MKTIIRCIDGDLLKTGKFIFSKKEKLKFIEAEKYCTNLGLQLPMPESVAENDEEGFQHEALLHIKLFRYWLTYGLMIA